MNWLHAAENGDVHAFADEVKELGLSLPQFTAHTGYRQPSEADRVKGQFDSEGLMDLSKLEGAFSDPTMQFYLCGPVGFMQFAAKQLVDLGVKQGKTFITNALVRIRCCDLMLPDGNIRQPLTRFKLPRRPLHRYGCE